MCSDFWCQLRFLKVIFGAFSGSNCCVAVSGSDSFPSALRRRRKVRTGIRERMKFKPPSAKWPGPYGKSGNGKGKVDDEMGSGNGKGKVPRPPTSPPPLWLPEEAWQGRCEHSLMRQELVARALEDEKKGTELQRVKGDNKRLKVALEVKEAELKRAKMDNSCLAADFQGLKAELEEKEAELAPMLVCDLEIDSEVEWGMGDSEDRI